MKKTNGQTYVCVPSSKINTICDALKHDGYIDNIKMYRGRDRRMDSVTIEQRSRTYKKILDECPSIDLERDAFAADHMTRNFVGMLSIILVSTYDETELTKYCIDVINKNA